MVPVTVMGTALAAAASFMVPLPEMAPPAPTWS
jgi:hypothetical protein